MQIILGSSSPRRKEILSYFHLPFKVFSSDFDEENIPFSGCAASHAKLLAHQKALTLSENHPDDVILTADTLVHLKGRLYGKPKDLKEAHEYLRKLSGETHEVYTGVCVMKANKYYLDESLTFVTFNPLSNAQIQSYLNAVHTLDKSGGYTIQGPGSLIVKKIEGCYYNVLGLPIQTVYQLLLKVGINLWDFVEKTS